MEKKKKETYCKKDPIFFPSTKNPPQKRKKRKEKKMFGEEELARNVLTNLLTFLGAGRKVGEKDGKPVWDKEKKGASLTPVVNTTPSL